METKNEKLAEKITRLARELEGYRMQMARCTHAFSEPTRATKEIQEPIFVRYEGHGSDPEPVYNWVPRTEYGWKRVCKQCGYEEYTAKSKPIVVGNGPDFGGKQ